MDEFDAMRKTVQECALTLGKKVPTGLLSEVLQTEILGRESRETTAQEVVRLISQAASTGED